MKENTVNNTMFFSYFMKLSFFGKKGIEKFIVFEIYIPVIIILFFFFFFESVIT